MKIATFLTFGFLVIAVLLFSSSIESVISKKYYSSYPAAQEENNHILWSDSTKLIWINFQKIVEDSISLYKAKAYRNVSVKYIKKDKDSIIYFVGAYFNQSKSIKSNRKDLGEKLLAHEQLHFDLSEVAARKIRKKYQNYTSNDKSFDKTNNFINSVFSAIMIESKKINELYDEETNHGINFTEQQKWNKKVAEMILKLEDYKNPRITIKRELNSH